MYIQSIPTIYNGVRFRSRLEARWAAMFDRLGWTWHYEPVDLKNYIPDFIITRGMRLAGEYGEVAVECKPFLPSERMKQTTTASKMARSGWTGPMILLGAIVPADGVCGRYHAPGLEGWQDVTLRWFPPVVTPIAEDDCTGYWDLDDVGGEARPFTLSMMWHAAGNATQWKAPDDAL